MKIKNTLNRLNKSHSFRVLFANIVPLLKMIKIIDLLQKLNKGSLLDPYDHSENPGKIVNRTYNLNNFNIIESFDKYSVDFKQHITLNKNLNFGYLLNPNKYDIYNIDKACNIAGVEYMIYNIKNPLLYSELTESKCDAIIIYPNLNNNETNRSVFHEATQILNTETSLMIYPSVRELNIYESKRNLFNFLILNKIPHPQTSVFLDYKSARAHIEKSGFPMVFKTHIGASSSGVEILNNQREAIKLLNRLFFKRYLRKMETDSRCGIFGYMIIQEYVEDVIEYRVIKVGESWFCYQKWKAENQTYLSGSGHKKMVNPKESVLDFCYEIAYKFGFRTMCFDVFETKNGKLLVNELQTWFGSYDPSEMYVDNTPGRYIKREEKWIFEPGFYNIYGSMVLRLIDLISLLNKSDLNS